MKVNEFSRRRGWEWRKRENSKKKLSKCHKAPETVPTEGAKNVPQGEGFLAGLP